MNWNQAIFPSLKRRGGCGSIKGAKPPESRRRGGRFGEIFRSEQFRRTDHPGRAVSERIHFMDSAATPPFQGGEYCLIPIHSHLHRAKMSHYQRDNYFFMLWRISASGASSRTGVMDSSIRSFHIRANSASP